MPTIPSAQETVTTSESVTVTDVKLVNRSDSATVSESVALVRAQGATASDAVATSERFSVATSVPGTGVRVLVAPTLAVPHLAYPFRILANGAQSYEQGTEDEVFSCVRAIADVFVGDCPDIPGFGIPEETFRVAVTGEDVVAALQDQEPRADTTVVTSVLGDLGAVAIAVSSGINS